MSRMTSDEYPMGYYESGANGSSYRGYGDDPGWFGILDLIKVAVPPPAVLYEVGCAKGYFVQHAREYGYDAFGVDISEYAIGAAPDAVRSYVEVGNVIDLSRWADESADVVFTSEFLEHLYPEEQDDALDELLRILKPGGLFIHRIGIIPEDDHPFADTVHCDDVTHRLLLRRGQWEGEFSSRGLRVDRDIEHAYDVTFQDRDWVGRGFAYWKAK